jgi:putative AbiEii toxin of type IV toxin-antitoxin system/AAA domain-containing protein
MMLPILMPEGGAFYKSLKLMNFTAFGDAHFDFVGPGVNVFVGENGTGKTHAMKLLFAWMLSGSFKDARDLGFSKTLVRTMQAQSTESLIRSGSANRAAILGLRYGDFEWAGRITALNVDEPSGPLDALPGGVERPVFIPAIEMMGHTKGFGSTYDVDELDFDWTIRDVVRLLSVRRRSPTLEYQDIVRRLDREVLHGKVEFDNEDERFYLIQEGSRQPMPLVAEGLRKIATLTTLLQNGSIREGTVLFWDEPEINLNPVLMDEVAHALIAIARSGVQIVIATHSYVLLEELREASRPGEVRYFGFDWGPAGVEVNSTDDLAKLSPNPILRQYESLYNRKIHSALAEAPST